MALIDGFHLFQVGAKSPAELDGSTTERIRKEGFDAWLGEAITDARVRLNPDGAVAERVDGLLFRCEFFDQRVERAVHHALFGRELVDRVHQLDRGIVDAADRIRDASDEAALSTALDDVARLLDERFGAIVDAPSR